MNISDVALVTGNLVAGTRQCRNVSADHGELDGKSDKDGNSAKQRQQQKHPCAHRRDCSAYAVVRSHPRAPGHTVGGRCIRAKNGGVTEVVAQTGSAVATKPLAETRRNLDSGADHRPRWDPGARSIRVR